MNSISCIFYVVNSLPNKDKKSHRQKISPVFIACLYVSSKRNLINISIIKTMNFLFLHSNISLFLHSTGISKEYGLILVSRQKLFSNFIRTTPRSKVHKVGLEVQANFQNYESSLKLNFGIFDENGNGKSGCEIVAHLKQVLMRYT